MFLAAPAGAGRTAVAGYGAGASMARGRIGFSVSYLIFWQAVGGHGEVFTGPGAKINIFATHATERAKFVGGRVNTVAATGGTSDPFGLYWRGLIFWFHEHRVSSKVASSLHVWSLSSSSWRISRIDTMSRLPLISGINSSDESSTRRSN